MRRILMILSLSALFHVALFAQIYIWTDENGVKHCSSTPPPNQSTAKQYKEVECSPQESNKMQNPQKSQETKKTKNRKSNQYPEIVMYSTQWCGVCKKAKAWLKSNKVPFKEYDIESSQEYRNEYQKLGGGGVPLIMIGNEKMSGWSEGRMRELLGMNN